MGKRKTGIDVYKAVSDGFLKITAEESPDGKVSDDSRGKAARLLLLLGKDEAAGVMARLEPEEAEVLAREIASTRFNKKGGRR